MDRDGDGLTFKDLMEVVLNMRGKNPVSVKDMKLQYRVLERKIIDAVRKVDSTLNTGLKQMCADVEALRERNVEVESYTSEAGSDDDDSDNADDRGGSGSPQPGSP